MARLTVVPVVGMGATLQVGSDQYPYTITKVSPSGTQFTMRADDHRVVSGDGSFQTGHPVIAYTENPQGSERVARLTTRGWNVKGQPVGVGSRTYYRDPSY